MSAGFIGAASSWRKSWPPVEGQHFRPLSAPLPGPGPAQFNHPSSVSSLVSAGDVIVYINDVCVLGTTHSDVVKLFQSVPIGQSVTLVLCRGYPLPYDPGEAADTANNTAAVISPLGITEQRPLLVNGRMGYENYLDYLSRTARLMGDPGQDQMNAQQQLLPPHPGDTHLDGSLPPPTGATPPDSVSMASSGTTQGELLTLTMVKGVDGFGFTIADSATGQRVKQVLEPLGCPGLSEGDLIVEINKQPVHGFTHAQVVELLKECGVGAETCLVVQRGGAGRGASNEARLSGGFRSLLLCSLSAPSGRLPSYLSHLLQLHVWAGPKVQEPTVQSCSVSEAGSSQVPPFGPFI